MSSSFILPTDFKVPRWNLLRDFGEYQSEHATRLFAENKQIPSKRSNLEKRIRMLSLDQNPNKSIKMYEDYETKLPKFLFTLIANNRKKLNLKKILKLKNKDSEKLFMDRLTEFAFIPNKKIVFMKDMLFYEKAFNEIMLFFKAQERKHKLKKEMAQQQISQEKMLQKNYILFKKKRREILKNIIRKNSVSSGREISLVKYMHLFGYNPNPRRSFEIYSSLLKNKLKELNEKIILLTDEEFSKIYFDVFPEVLMRCRNFSKVNMTNIREYLIELETNLLISKAVMKRDIAEKYIFPLYDKICK